MFVHCAAFVCVIEFTMICADFICTVAQRLVCDRISRRLRFVTPCTRCSRSLGSALDVVVVVVFELIEYNAIIMTLPACDTQPSVTIHDHVRTRATRRHLRTHTCTLHSKRQIVRTPNKRTLLAYASEFACARCVRIEVQIKMPLKS